MHRLLPIALIMTGVLQDKPAYAASTLTRAQAAQALAQNLNITLTQDANELYGLFPGVFPGGYDGTFDVAYPKEVATLEHIIVSLVRWAGWDTVHYDNRIVPRVKPFVTPEGFPFYAPDPTPRSIPYIVVAMSKGLIKESDLPALRTPVALERITELSTLAKRIRVSRPLLHPLVLDTAVKLKLDQARKNSEQLIILPVGFHNYAALEGLSNRILDLNAPGLRLFSGRSSLRDGKQDYFPLGALDTQFTVALYVPEDSYAHQSEAIYGIVENASTTVNAVGIWGSASSLKKDARVWGGFIKGSTSEGEKNDAQVIGLEIDVINNALPGVSPNRSKTGLQIVGIGKASVTNGIEIIGAGPAKWGNGILFSEGAIQKDGAVIGLSQSGNVARGIDFSNTTFGNAALLLNKESPISFRSRSGNASLIYTDDFGNGHLVMQAGVDGLRVTNNDNNKNLMVVQPNGDIVTPLTSLGKLATEVESLKTSHATSGRVAPPKASSESCTAGAWAADDRFFYVCFTANQWRRAELSSW